MTGTVANPKVSVIIPVYNTEAYLRQCLDSIVNQTLKDIEIICVDDASTDGSWEILQEYAAVDSRFRLLQQSGGGAGAARNYGLRYACGRYLSFLDSDDFFEPQMLEAAYARAVSVNADIVVFGSNIYLDDSGTFVSGDYAIHYNLMPEERPFAAADVQKNLFKVFACRAWDKLFRADFVRENQLAFQVQHSTNDMFFVNSAIARAGRIDVIPEIYVHYRKSSNNISANRSRSWPCFYSALTALRRQLKDWGLYERVERDYINYGAHLCVWTLNAVDEAARVQLMEKLRREWLQDLGILDRPEEYFYSRKEYRQCRLIYEMPSKWNLDEQRATERPLVMRGLDCLRDNGLRYTVDNILEKIRKRVIKK